MGENTQEMSQGKISEQYFENLESKVELIDQLTQYTLQNNVR